MAEAEAAAAAKGACDVIFGITQHDLTNKVNTAIHLRYLSGFILMPDRSCIFVSTEPTPTPWKMVCCFRKKAGLESTLSYSQKSDDFVLGGLFDNTGFSQVVGDFYFGTKTEKNP